MALWFYVNLISLILLFFSILYVGYYWHLYRKREYKNKQLANEVATGLKDGKEKEEIVHDLQDTFEEQKIRDKVEKIQGLLH